MTNYIAESATICFMIMVKFHKTRQSESETSSKENFSLLLLSIKMTELASRIQKQIEFYFSDANLSCDKFMSAQLAAHAEQAVPVSVLMTFKRVQALTEDPEVILDALKASESLIVDTEKKTVRRTAPFVKETAKKDGKVLYVSGFPKDTSLDDLLAFFSGLENVKVALVRRRMANKEFSGAVWAEFETKEDAESVLAMDLVYGESKKLKSSLHNGAMGGVKKIRSATLKFVPTEQPFSLDQEEKKKLMKDVGRFTTANKIKCTDTEILFGLDKTIAAETADAMNKKAVEGVLELAGIKGKLEAVATVEFEGDFLDAGKLVSFKMLTAWSPALIGQEEPSEENSERKKDADPVETTREQNMFLKEKLTDLMRGIKCVRVDAKIDASGIIEGYARFESSVSSRLAELAAEIAEQDSKDEPSTEKPAPILPGQKVLASLGGLEFNFCTMNVEDEEKYYRTHVYSKAGDKRKGGGDRHGHGKRRRY